MRPIMLSLAVLVVAAAIWLTGRDSAAGTPEPPLVDGSWSAAQGAVFAPDRIVVSLRPGVNAASVQALHASLGGRVIKSYQRSRLQMLETPAGANIDAIVAAYQRSPLVDQAGRSRIAVALEEPNDTNYSAQWDMQDTAGGIRVEPAWAVSANKGAGVVVAVIDTGVPYETFTRPADPVTGMPAMSFEPAPDLAGMVTVAPKNYVFDDTHANDDNGHGSHVTGTIRQTTNNAYGVVGVAYNSTIMPIKVLDWGGSGADADLVDALYYAVDNGARVINMSLGFTGTGNPDAGGSVCTEVVGLNAALDYAYAHGVVVVAAAGNDGGPIVTCPAAYPTVIAVGATRYDAQVTSYSNRGAALDVAAPGGDPNVDQNGDGFSDGITQETYCTPASLLMIIAILNGTAADFSQFCDVFMSGTSMATPHVSGIAALLLGDDSSLTPDEVRTIIESTARDGGSAGWDDAYGWGVVDAGAAMLALGGGPTPTPTPTNTPTPTYTAGAAPTSTATSVPSDVVVITKATYNGRKSELVIEATSTGNPPPVLLSYDNSNPASPVLLGSLNYNSKRKIYSRTFAGIATKPLSVLVTSSSGGSATSAVGGK